MKISAIFFISILLLGGGLDQLHNQAWAGSPSERIPGHLGKVTFQKGRKTVQFITQTAEYSLDYARLPKSVRQEVDSALALREESRSEVQIPFPEKLSLHTNPLQIEIRPDCSEAPMNMNQLEKLATSSSVNSMQDFLNQIPGQSMQSFTFVTNSKSIQKGEGAGVVSSLWPRVLRSTMDGKITMSYVCNPANPNYGTVEVIYFDDSTGEFKTRELEFQKPDQASVAPSSRIHRNPESCIKCHAGATLNGKVSLKPNWPEYFSWFDCQRTRGISMYGGSDDEMRPEKYRSRTMSSRAKRPKDCFLTNDEAAHREEVEDFRKFKELQKNNPCYSSLPWAKIPDGMENSPLYAQYKNYPYKNESIAGDNYSVRTNLRFTDTYSHLMAKRNAALLQKAPGYPVMKYYLAMEAQGCLNSTDRKSIERLLPSVHFSDTSELGAGTSLLAAFSKNAGLQDRDWSMEFQLENDPSYQAGMPGENSGTDLVIPEVVAGEVLKDLGRSSQKLQKLASQYLTRGSERQFGSRFACIDRLGGALKPSMKDASSELCKVLRKENDINLAHLGSFGKCTPLTDSHPAAELQNELVPVLRVVSADAIARGKKLIQLDFKGKCVSCHSEGSYTGLSPDFSFIPNESAGPENFQKSLARLKAGAKEGLLQKLEKKLVQNKTMPPPPAGDDLTDQDRQDILSYLESLLK
ncbi:MAG: cytochrome c [Methylotenera sp.]|nr:cytochrome c [Oligoflexia bacterium]